MINFVAELNNIINDRTQMTADNRRIFLTGATGVMGAHALSELVSSDCRYDITVLARDSDKNRRKLRRYVEKGVKVIWGDLLDKEAVAAGVAAADVILHVGGMVSPEADWHPAETLRVNVGAMRNILDAALPRKDEVRLVYVGSVSQYGSHCPPGHWGECGDPLLPTDMDAYANSKTEAERMLLESDLRRWVSLRLSAILHSGLLMKASNPVAFHVPLKGVLEWITAEDSGRVLERACRPDVPEAFWCRCYNLGGGADYRMTNYEFECRLLKAMGCPPPEKIFKPNWFATENFHGMWYADSDILEDILHFRSGVSPDTYFKQMRKELPCYFRLAPLVPAVALRIFMRRVASTPGLGTLWWIEHNDESRIRTFWGSREAWESIPDWDGIDLARPSDENPGCRGDAGMCVDDPEAPVDCVCPECGSRYLIKMRTYAAGHRCIECLHRASMCCPRQSVQS